MNSPETVLGDSPSNGDILFSEYLNDKFDALVGYRNVVLQNRDPRTGDISVPIGGIVAWHKNFSNTPTLTEGWVECNGGTISDGDSPINGQTIPNLNGTDDTNKRYLRGSTTYGTTGGSHQHTHNTGAGGRGSSGSLNNSVTPNANTGATSSIPATMDVVFIMRIK